MAGDFVPTFDDTRNGWNGTIVTFRPSEQPVVECLTTGARSRDAFRHGLLANHAIENELP